MRISLNGVSKIRGPLLLPQSILLGMTFPLLSGALIRRFPDRAGNTLALLYFVNSLGAAVGVIVSGFVLMDRFGLPGTILTAGLINIAVALLIWSLARQPAWRQPGAAPDKQRESTTWPAPQVTLLVAAGITGAASFIYEIAWLRMLNLVLGATTHSFELMLSAFILGLACGSLWIRRYIQVLTDPVRFLGIVQIFMGCFALATLWLYAETFYWMAGLLELVSRTSAGYLAFNLGSHAIAFAVMLPATFCAGTTLPLITYALLNSGYGERSVGQVYAVNTLGAIIGVVLAVQVGLTLIGLKGVVLAGAALDIGLGLVLLRRRAEATVNARVLVPGVIGLGFLGMTWAAVQLNPLQMASTVYLFGNPDILRDAEVPFHRDGKSATVNLIRYPSGILGITTNGKTDAAIQMREGKPANLNEFTMTPLGALPLAVHPGAKAIAVIGFGSGLTTHTLLASPDVERVDTIEIEPAVVLAAEQFRPRVERAFADPRSHVYIDDAKSFFSSQQNDYDIIVSEPSNPWVSGIASLYTREFYRFVRGHLRDQGIFAQWLHVYDLDMPLFGSVLNAMAESFPDYAVYNLNDQDALIIAGGSLVERNAQLAQTLPDAVLPELARLGMQRGDLPRLRIGSRSLLQPLLDSYAVTANSDYFPVLDLNAVRTRFLQKDARDLFRLQNSPLPLLEMLSAEDVRPAARYTTHRSATAFLANLGQAPAIVRYLPGIPPLPGDADLPAQRMRHIVSPDLWLGTCPSRDIGKLWLETLLELAGATLPYLPHATLEPLWQRFARTLCDGKNQSSQRAWLELIRATSKRDAAQMLSAAFMLLNTHGESLTNPELGYVVSSAMLAASQRRDWALVTRLWQVHGQHFTDDYARVVDLRLMGALARNSQRSTLQADK